MEDFRKALKLINARFIPAFNAMQDEMGGSKTNIIGILSQMVASQSIAHVSKEGIYEEMISKLEGKLWAADKRNNLIKGELTKVNAENETLKKHRSQPWHEEASIISPEALASVMDEEFPLSLEHVCKNIGVYACDTLDKGMVAECFLPASGKLGIKFRKRDLPAHKSPQMTVDAVCFLSDPIWARYADFSKAKFRLLYKINIPSQSQLSAKPYNFGDFIKELRMERGVSLEGFCQTQGIDLDLMRDIERGITSHKELTRENYTCIMEWTTDNRMRIGSDWEIRSKVGDLWNRDFVPIAPIDKVVMGNIRHFTADNKEINKKPCDIEEELSVSAPVGHDWAYVLGNPDKRFRCNKMASDLSICVAEFDSTAFDGSDTVCRIGRHSFVASEQIWYLI